MTSVLQMSESLFFWQEFSDQRKTNQMNIEQGMSKEEGGNRHEKAQEDTGSLVRLISISGVRRLVYLLSCRVLGGYLIR